MQKRTLLVCSLLFMTLAVGPGAAATNESEVSIQNVTATPEQPSPGEPTTISATIKNIEAETLEIEWIFIVEAGTGERLERVRNLGTVAPGASVTVPVTTTFEEEGTQNLRVMVDGRVGNSSFRYRYPLSVVVQDSSPQVSLDTSNLVAGSESTANVTVAYGGTERIRNVQMSIGGNVSDITPKTELWPKIEPGATLQKPITVTPESNGTAKFDIQLEYTTANGYQRSISKTQTVSVEQSEVDVDVEAETGSEAAYPPIETEISNFGNTELTDVVISLRDDNSVIEREAVDPIAPNENRKVAINVSEENQSTITVDVSYRAAGEEKRQQETVSYEPNPAEILLTGIEVEEKDGYMLLTGTANNMGVSDADSVVVKLVSEDGIEPVNPYKNYFVGSIPAGDFGAFDLTVDLSDGTTTVPVRVSYIVDGQQKSEVVNLEIGGKEATQINSSKSSNSLVVYGLGGVFSLAIIGVMGIAIRRSRSRSINEPPETEQN